VPGFRALYDGPSRCVAEAIAGGAWTINTACSSAANALGLARRWLARGRIDVALVAGFDVVSPFVYSGFGCLGAVDPEPTTPFGAARRGLNLGDAAVAFVLVRSADATGGTRVIGYGSSCDAHHLTRPDLGGKGLARAVRAALGDAGVEATQIGLVSAHGTGTPYNDTMEAAAFADVFGDAVPPLHCAKPIFGHTLGAAGAVDALAVSLMLEHGVVPRTYLRGAEDPELAVHPGRTETSIERGALAISTSSGFGGSNAVLVMTRGDA
jgi:3-oxoacyl-(acyl-carrier-protein) synthase